MEFSNFARLPYKAIEIYCCFAALFDKRPLLGNMTHAMLFGEGWNDHVHPMRRFMNLIKEGVATISDPHNEVSDSAKDFLRKLLEVDPLKRMTVDEAFNHAWLTDPTSATALLKTSWRRWEKSREHPSI